MFTKLVNFVGGAFSDRATKTEIKKLSISVDDVACKEIVVNQCIKCKNVKNLISKENDTVPMVLPDWCLTLTPMEEALCRLYQPIVMVYTKRGGKRCKGNVIAFPQELIKPQKLFLDMSKIVTLYLLKHLMSAKK